MHVEDDGKKVLRDFFELGRGHCSLLLEIFVWNLIVFDLGVDHNHWNVAFRDKI